MQQTQETGQSWMQVGLWTGAAIIAALVVAYLIGVF